MADARPVDHVNPVFLTRVVLKNYRSIGGCDVALGPLTFLVGPNNAGKSNFLDALRLITNALDTSLDHALRERGGIREVRRRANDHPTSFGIRIELVLRDGRRGHFAFEVGTRSGDAFVVEREECVLDAARYLVKAGKIVHAPGDVSPPAADDRLYLVHAAGLPAFRPVFDALSRMGFYNLDPARMRALQPPGKGELLARDGSNLASVVARLGQPARRAVKQRIEEYLSRVVPDVMGFDAKRIGHLESLELRQRVEGATDAWHFPAIDTSDGTLRALGVLVALFQSADGGLIPLVGIEEPETALHPAAAGVLRDCIIEASRQVQVIVTSHSADLLDDPDLPSGTIRAVEASEGRTLIGELEPAAQSALRDRLYTAGELLRAGQLAPDPAAMPTDAQLELFGKRSA